MTAPAYHLVSFKLCPFVQSSVLTLEEKGLPYEVTYIDLRDKPQWFLEMSPLGKVPVLRVGEDSIFESAVINEYIEESSGGGMHPTDLVQRAKNRAWIEFTSNMLALAWQLKTATSLERAREIADDIHTKLARIEVEVRGPLFNGEEFSLVDAAIAPLFQRLDWVERYLPEVKVYRDLSRVRAWRDALVSRPSFAASTVPDIDEVFEHFMLSALERAATPEEAPVISHRLCAASAAE